MSTDCIFCKIVKHEVPTEFVYQNDLVVAFKDLHPIAPVHILLIPKKHIPTVDDLEKQDEQIAGRLIMTAQKIARDLKIAETGYKLLFRVKKHGGQEIDHLHLHLLGGAPLTEKIRPIKASN
jgi:histidine triad (HIT) family protein